MNKSITYIAKELEIDLEFEQKNTFNIRHAGKHVGEIHKYENGPSYYSYQPLYSTHYDRRRNNGN